MLKVEAERWEKTGFYGNTLLDCSRMIPLAIKISADLYIPNILEDMLRVLKTKEVVMHSSGVAEVIKALESIPPQYSADVQAIDQLIRALRSKLDRD